jgi:hypothetical protein
MQQAKSSNLTTATTFSSGKKESFDNNKSVIIKK